MLSGDPTSLRGDKLLVSAGWPFSAAVKHPDVEGIAAEWVQAGQLAMRSVPIEGEDLLFGMV